MDCLHNNTVPLYRAGLYPRHYLERSIRETQSKTFKKIRTRRRRHAFPKEPATHYEIIVKLWEKSCKSVVHILESILSKYPKEVFRSITVDNGSEFQDYEHMENDKKGNKRLTIYCCHLYWSTERASNERANRIIRRFAPKGQSLAKYTSKDCQKIADWMNNYPRKILDYFTSAELFQMEIEKFLE